MIDAIPAGPVKWPQSQTTNGGWYAALQARADRPFGLVVFLTPRFSREDHRFARRTLGLSIQFLAQRVGDEVDGRSIGKKLNCYAKCRKGEHKGTTPAGTCTPTATDPKTVECIGKEESKAEVLIDKKCESSVSPKADKPECFGTSTGQTWAGLLETAIDNGQASLYCASPSGAFVDDAR